MQDDERSQLREAIARSEAARAEAQVWRAEATVPREKLESLLMQQPGVVAASEGFEAIAADARSQAEATAAAQRAASVDASRARASQLGAMSASRVQGFQAIADAGILPGDRQSILLQTPFEVSLVGAPLTDHSVASGSSYARFEFRVGEESKRHARLHFSYVWQNPANRYALIEAHGYVILDGSVAAVCSGGFWPRDRRAAISVTPRLSLFDWGQAPLSPAASTYREPAVSLKVSDWSPATLGPMAGADLFRGFDLSVSEYMVKPNGTIGVVVAVDLAGDTGHDGEVWADFADGNHRVVSPGVLILVIS